MRPLFFTMAALLAIPALATQSSKTTCETLLADNTSGAISPQDLRDCTTESVLFLDGTSTADLIVNEAGAARDVRVESDTDTHILFIDGSANAIGISDSTPTAGKLTLGLDVDWETDNTHDIGTATSRVQDIYALALKADDSGTAVTIPAIDNNGSDVVFDDILKFSDDTAYTKLMQFGDDGSGDWSFENGAANTEFLFKYGGTTKLTWYGPNAFLIANGVQWACSSDGGCDLGSTTRAYDELYVDEIELQDAFTSAPVACSSTTSGRMYMHDDSAGNTGLCICRESSSAWAYESLTTGGSCS